MVYISSSGVVKERPWGLAAISRLVMGFLNFLYLFFTTLIQQDPPTRSESNWRSSGPDSGPPPPPRRGMGRPGRMGGVTIPSPPMGG